MPITGLQIPAWAAVAVVLVGGLFVVMGVLTLNSARRRQRTWTPSTGRVIASRLDGDGHLRLQVEYRNGAGRPVRFWNRFTASGGTDRTGERVDILVNPADPTDAVISKGGPTGSLVGGVLLGFGALAEIIGIGLLVDALG